MRIIFVGVHNKPNLQPLCSSTKTGKLVNRIINELPKGFEIEKTNLFNTDHFPKYEKMNDLGNEWYWTNLPTDEDIIVLLGAITHKQFRHSVKNLIKIAHPASKYSHKDMDEYVLSAAGKIKKYMQKVSSMAKTSH
jgi:hypothetical protein